MKHKEIINVLNERYTTKVYDKSKRVSDEDIEVLLESLRLSPSSMGLQPWHFFVIASEDMKKQFAEAAMGDNENKVLNCSHLFVLASKNKIDAEYIEKYVRSIDEARGTNMALNIKERSKRYIKLIRYGWLIGRDRERAYYRNQVYISLGFLAYTAGLLGVQSTILGGMNFKKCDKILDLKKNGLSSVMVVAVGYASADEPKEAKIKVRFPKEEVITYL